MDLCLDGVPVNIVTGTDSVKFLGVELDSLFTFKHQVQAVATKVKKGIFALAQSKKVLPKEARRLVYFALVQSHLEYASLTWVPLLVNCTCCRCCKIKHSGSWKDSLRGHISI
jgi:hypothetical protein